MNEITIYHNPNCGTSRNTLAMIRNSGIEPTIIYYLETPLAKDVLVQLIADMKITVRALLRKNVEPYEQLNLEKDSYTDDQLIDVMLQYPLLINRPIVVTPLGVKLCRPSEVVLDILPNQQQSEFIKEDGQIVIGRHDVQNTNEEASKHKH
ncbi:glutaredoxin-dependent arsenate reductase [Providencia vermicola]|uniref:glutaredoxin-dependent arsenate reductase n=1 Tax=Providencia vermicola TaxID=333965 RepID=UPI0032DA1A94